MEQAMLTVLRESMEECLAALAKRFSGLRTGRATPALLEPLSVEAYGGRMPLSQLATVNAPEARLLTVHVWDATVVSAVDKAIQAFGFSPQTEGAVLRVILPELSQQRRQELVKMAKTYAEDARVGIRNQRRHFLEGLSKDKFSEDDIFGLKKEGQKITDEFMSKVEDMMHQKEKDILKV